MPLLSGIAEGSFDLKPSDPLAVALAERIIELAVVRLSPRIFARAVGARRAVCASDEPAWAQANPARSRDDDTTTAELALLVGSCEVL